MDGAIRDLLCKRLQADEIWFFVGVKRKNRSLIILKTADTTRHHRTFAGTRSRTLDK
jgi:hypothetical protein